MLCSTFLIEVLVWWKFREQFLPQKTTVVFVRNLYDIIPLEKK